jgi:hypothetical protein
MKDLASWNETIWLGGPLFICHPVFFSDLDVSFEGLLPKLVNLLQSCPVVTKLSPNKSFHDSGGTKQLLGNRVIYGKISFLNSIIGAKIRFYCPTIDHHDCQGWAMRLSIPPKFLNKEIGRSDWCMSADLTLEHKLIELHVCFLSIILHMKKEFRYCIGQIYEEGWCGSPRKFLPENEGTIVIQSSLAKAYKLEDSPFAAVPIDFFEKNSLLDLIQPD